jgi:hypothetical protein
MAERETLQHGDLRIHTERRDGRIEVRIDAGREELGAVRVGSIGPAADADVLDFVQFVDDWCGGSLRAAREGYSRSGVRQGRIDELSTGYQELKAGESLVSGS